MNVIEKGLDGTVTGTGTDHCIQGEARTKLGESPVDKNCCSVQHYSPVGSSLETGEKNFKFLVLFDNVASRQRLMDTIRSRYQGMELSESLLSFQNFLSLYDPFLLRLSNQPYYIDPLI